MVKTSAVNKCLKIGGIVFIAVSVVELIFALILSTLVLDFDGTKMTVSALLLDSIEMPIEGLFAWVYLLISFGLYLIIGLIFFKIGKNELIGENLLSKHLIVMGMMLFIITFCKLEYIVILANADLRKIMNYTFQEALFDPAVAPYPIAAVLWFFFTAVVCAYLIEAIIITATGIKWGIDLDKLTQEDNKLEA
ncbi:MAG: hypothetical protein ACTSR8_12330 [Promethearchaeota archaeon]